MKALLKLAHRALANYFQDKKPEVSDEIKKRFSKKQACFVTLTLNGRLRGCVGSLYPRQEIYKDVIENTLNASFYDTRFLPLTKQELKKIKIEISILTIPKKLEFKDEKDLLEKINNEIGIILKKGFCQATFLPQVWEQLPDKIEFLEHLSLKEGLNKDAWKDAEIWWYEVEKVGEE